MAEGSSPLPPGWAVAEDYYGRRYYYNISKKLTQWTVPLREPLLSSTVQPVVVTRPQAADTFGVALGPGASSRAIRPGHDTSIDVRAKHEHVDSVTVRAVTIPERCEGLFRELYSLDSKVARSDYFDEDDGIWDVEGLESDLANSKPPSDSAASLGTTSAAPSSAEAKPSLNSAGGSLDGSGEPLAQIRRARCPCCAMISSSPADASHHLLTMLGIVHITWRNEHPELVGALKECCKAEAPQTPSAERMRDNDRGVVTVTPPTICTSGTPSAPGDMKNICPCCRKQFCKPGDAMAHLLMKNDFDHVLWRTAYSKIVEEINARKFSFRSTQASSPWAVEGCPEMLSLDDLKADTELVARAEDLCNSLGPGPLSSAGSGTSKSRKRKRRSSQAAELVDIDTWVDTQVDTEGGSSSNPQAQPDESQSVLAAEVARLRSRLEVMEAEKQVRALADQSSGGLVCEEDFMPRFLAFRQYVEHVVESGHTKASRTKPWRIEVRRADLCCSVLSHFSNGFSKLKMWQSTEVTFIDSTGAPEEGVDSGGLTAEMYSALFRELLLRETSLFEAASGEASPQLSLQSQLIRPRACLSRLCSISSTSRHDIASIGFKYRPAPESGCPCRKAHRHRTGLVQVRAGRSAVGPWAGTLSLRVPRQYARACLPRREQRPQRSR